MSLKIAKITRFNIWDRIFCPVCKGRSFISVENSTVYCKLCNARFEIRDTAGDPGYVADCFTNTCVNVMFPDGSIVYYEEVAKKRVPEGHCYWIDKEGEYCSGWIYFTRLVQVQVDPEIPSSQDPIK